MKKILARALGLFVLVTLLLPSFQTVKAQQETTSLRVSPVSFNLGANPGDKIDNQIRVTNLSSYEASFETAIESIIGVNEQGRVRLGEEENEFSITSWITVTPEKFSLKPQETKLISYTINVPKNAEPGGHYGSILVGTVASDSPEFGSGTVQRLGSLLLLTVSGQAREQATITKFNAKTFSGAWDELTADDGTTKILIAKDEDLSKEEANSYFSEGPVAFDLVFKNSGNVHFNPVGFVTIRNIFGKKVAELAIDSRNVFPGVERQITVIWPTEKLWGVKYTAQFTGIYGSTNQQVTAGTSFWAFPLIPGIVIIAGALLIVLARKRLIKAIGILIKGK